MVYFVEKNQKLDCCSELLNDRKDDIDRALVFTRTKHGANKVHEEARLRLASAAAAIHGNKSQGARERALDGFKAGRMRVLVATDIAARGIDIKELSHVINFDLPNEPESYVHRVGRTGRAGLTGAAISFCATDERPFLRDIERLTKRPLDRADRDAVAAAPRLAPNAAARFEGGPSMPNGRDRPHGARPGGRKSYGGRSDATRPPRRRRAR